MIYYKKNGQIIPVSVNLRKLSPKTEETKQVQLSMENGDQVVFPTAEDKTLSQVVIEKPSTLTPENIKKDVNIGGVVGTMVSGLDASGITDFYYLCYKNRFINQLDKLDTSEGTNFSYMFAECSALTSVPQLDTSEGTNFSYMFRECRALTSVPQLNTSKGTNFSGMFYYCTTLTSVPQLDTSKGTGFSSMFRDCKALTSVPQLDTSKCTNFSDMFNGCSQLVTVSSIDLLSATSTTNMFASCSKLKNAYVKNIQTNLSVQNTTQLTVESLVYMCGQCIKQSSTKKLTVSSGNKNALNGVYVKFTDPTQTTIAVGEKGEVVECESTDAGAMTVFEYMSLKSWSIST